jgi:hypothetical protein
MVPLAIPNERQVRVANELNQTLYIGFAGRKRFRPQVRAGKKACHEQCKYEEMDSHERYSLCTFMATRGTGHPVLPRATQKPESWDSSPIRYAPQEPKPHRGPSIIPAYYALATMRTRTEKPRDLASWKPSKAPFAGLKAPGA